MSIIRKVELPSGQEYTFEDIEARQSLQNKADKATTLSGYGITDAYTKNETDLSTKQYVDNAINNITIPPGSLDFQAAATTLSPGAAATVTKTINPTTNIATFTFGIPRGSQGEVGPQGQTGPQGESIYDIVFASPYIAIPCDKANNIKTGGFTTTLDYFAYHGNQMVYSTFVEATGLPSNMTVTNLSNATAGTRGQLQITCAAGLPVDEINQTEYFNVKFIIDQQQIIKNLQWMSVRDEGVIDDNVKAILIDGSVYEPNQQGITTFDSETDSFQYLNVENFARIGESEAIGDYSIAVGDHAYASGDSSSATGLYTTAGGTGSHAEGGGTSATGNRSHAEGSSTQATTDNAHAEGGSTIASGIDAHAEGSWTVASGSYSHAEGMNTTASAIQSHAEGSRTIASEAAAHAEGSYSTASGSISHAEGSSTTASAMAAHAEGNYTQADGSYSHAEGSYTHASGQYSHAEGLYTTATANAQHTSGKYNINDNNQIYAEIVGNGTSEQNRSNARTLDWNGNAVYAGKVTVGINPTNNMDLTTKQYVDTAINNITTNIEDSVQQAQNHAQAAAASADIAQETLTDINSAIQNAVDEIVSDEVAAQVAQIQVQSGQTVIDGTLAVQGAAAEAKATGDAIDKVSNNINSFASEDNIHFLANHIGKRIDLNDEMIDGGYTRCSDYIEVPQDTVSITYRQMMQISSGLTNLYPAMVTYKADKTVYAYHSPASGNTDEYRTMSIDPSVIRYVRFNQVNPDRPDYDHSMFKFNKFNLADIKDRIPFLTQGGAVPTNTDIFTLKPNKIYHITSGTATMTNLPYEGFLGIIIPFHATTTTYPATATFIIAISSSNRFFVTHSWGTEATFANWTEFSETNDTLFKYRTHFTEGSDVNDFVDTGLYLVDGSLAGSNKPFGTVSCHILVFKDPYNNLIQLAFSSDGRVVYRRKNRLAGFTTEWTHIGKSTFVGKYIGEFTAQKQLINTGIELKAGTTYFIENNPVSENQPYSGFYNVFIASNPSAYSKHIGKWERTVRFTPTLDGTLGIYNPTGTGGYNYVGGVNLSVYKEDKEDQKQVYSVGTDAATYDFTSFTAALLALKDNLNQKELHIYPGTYDLFQEYIDAGMPVYEGDSPTYDYFDYCVWIPANTHVIGHGIVRLNWMPDAEQTTANQAATVSPINVAGSMTLENVEIHTKNSRYCIHDDPLGKREYIMAVKKYINVRCYKYANDPGLGWTHVLGFGFDLGDRYEFHNCIFMNTAYGRTLYGHARAASESINLGQVHSPNIIVDNCIMQTNGTRCVVFGNAAGNDNLHIRVDMNNCYINGEIYIADEGSSGDGGTRRNAFDLKVLGGNITEDKVFIRDPNNPYPPIIQSVASMINNLSDSIEEINNLKQFYDADTEAISIDWEYGGVNNTTGEEFDSTIRLRSPIFDVTPGQILFIDNPKKLQVLVYYYDAQTNFTLFYEYFTNTETKIVVPDDVAYIRFVIKYESGANINLLEGSNIRFLWSKKIKIAQYIKNPIQIGTTSNFGSIIGNRATLSKNNNIITVTNTGTDKYFGFYSYLLKVNDAKTNGHKWYVRIDDFDASHVTGFTNISIVGLKAGSSNNNGITSTEGIFTITEDCNVIIVFVNSSEVIPQGDYATFTNFQLIDLTEMFGAGFEPSLETFKEIYGNKIYPRNGRYDNKILDEVKVITVQAKKDLTESINSANAISLNAADVAMGGIMKRWTITDTITATLYNNGTLWISGKGTLPIYSYDVIPPWRENQYMRCIRKIIIDETIIINYGLYACFSQYDENHNVIWYQNEYDGRIDYTPNITCIYSRDYAQFDFHHINLAKHKQPFSRIQGLPIPNRYKHAIFSVPKEVCTSDFVQAVKTAILNSNNTYNKYGVTLFITDSPEFNQEVMRQVDYVWGSAYNNVACILAPDLADDGFPSHWTEPMKRCLTEIIPYIGKQYLFYKDQNVSKDEAYPYRSCGLSSMSTYAGYGWPDPFSYQANVNIYINDVVNNQGAKLYTTQPGWNLSRYRGQPFSSSLEQITTGLSCSGFISWLYWRYFKENFTLGASRNYNTKMGPIGNPLPLKDITFEELQPFDLLNFAYDVNKDGIIDTKDNGGHVAVYLGKYLNANNDEQIIVLNCGMGGGVTFGRWWYKDAWFENEGQINTAKAMRFDKGGLSINVISYLSAEEMGSGEEDGSNTESGIDPGQGSEPGWNN